MNKYIPNIYTKNIFTVNYKKLKENKIECLLFDLDNTIIPYHNIEIDNKTKQLIEEISKDFHVIIFSNSNKKRLDKFKDQLNVEIIHSAKKPFSVKFNKVIKRYSKDSIAIIGDQLLTDIKGGNNVDITTILIDPISKKEFFATKINRFFENKILKNLSPKLERGKYYE